MQNATNTAPAVSVHTLNSFIDSTITLMTERKNSLASIAQVVQKMNHPNPLNRIALAYVHLQNERQMASKAFRSVALKPEMLLTFVQNVSNMACWQARRLMKAQEQHEASMQAAGVDFSERVAEDVGVEGVSTDLIADVLKEDAECLENVYNWLAGRMNYLQSIEDFHMYAEFEAPPVSLSDQPVVGESSWKLVHFADNFEGALCIMERVLESLGTEQLVEVGNDARSLDFASMTVTHVRQEDLPTNSVAYLPRKAEKPGLLSRLWNALNTPQAA